MDQICLNGLSALGILILGTGDEEMSGTTSLRHRSKLESQVIISISELSFRKQWRGRGGWGAGKLEYTFISMRSPLG